MQASGGGRLEDEVNEDSHWRSRLAVSSTMRKEDNVVENDFISA